MQLQDAKIIVTGGAQGLGAHFAKRIVEAGAPSPRRTSTRPAWPRSSSPARATRAKLVVRRLDVADDADIASFVEFASGAIGPVNASSTTRASSGMGFS